MTTAIVPYQPVPSGAPAVIDAMATLKSIRTFVAEELAPNVDFGAIPGTGTKRVMLLPGAQKVAMYLNVYPEYEVEAAELGGGHVEYLVNTRLVSRASGARVGSGIGSCSTMEGKYRYRNAQRACPACGAAAIIQTKKGRNPGGYWCVPDKGGCGANFNAGDRKVEGQELGKVENENIHDQRNTVLKMAKKRSLVDAAIGLACLADQFTQDIDDTYDLTATPAPTPTAAPKTPRRDPDREAARQEFQATPATRPVNAKGTEVEGGYREDLADFLDEAETFDDFVDRCCEALEKAAPGERDENARKLSLANRLVSDAIAANDEIGFNPASVLQPARAGEEPKRDAKKTWGAMAWLLQQRRSWTVYAAADYVIEKGRKLAAGKRPVKQLPREPGSEG